MNRIYPGPQRLYDRPGEGRHRRLQCHDRQAAPGGRGKSTRIASSGESFSKKFLKNHRMILEETAAFLYNQIIAKEEYCMKRTEQEGEKNGAYRTQPVRE